MPTEEKALNGVLSDLLKEVGLHTQAEVTNKHTHKRRIDIAVFENEDSPFFTAIECKIGTSKKSQKKAIEDARNRLNLATCGDAIAICYPTKLKEKSKNTIRQNIEEHGLLMARIDKDSKNIFFKGYVRDLSELITSQDQEVKNTRLVFNILQNGIKESSEYIEPFQIINLSKILGLPYDTKNDKKDLRPALIGCLILANTLLLQNRLNIANVKITGGLDKLDFLLNNDDVNLKYRLLENWYRIKEKDYVPVIAPAILILEELSVSKKIELLLKQLIKSVINCARLINKVQTDFIGPLYHGLLETARYDGSFYTNVPTSILLSELAITKKWFNQVSKNDINNISEIKICDPACGTGTLLMSSARSIKKRIQEKIQPGGGVDEVMWELVHRYLIENILNGLDINRHAIHLSASMLTMSAPRIDYSKMNLWRMNHGVDRDNKVSAGSLDMLIGEEIIIEDESIKPIYSKQDRVYAKGNIKDTIDLNSKCDLVIMNPPFTRDDIRNKHLPVPIQKKVREREKTIANQLKNDIRGVAITNKCSIGNFFLPLADQLLKKERGTIASVLPTTAFLGTSNKGYRRFILEKFHVEVVITSHDNKRNNFSGNTSIHESLLVLRKPKQNRKTLFVSLKQNPINIFDAQKLSEKIKEVLLVGVGTSFDYGVPFFIDLTTQKHLKGNPWREVAFLNPILVEKYDDLDNNSAFLKLIDIIGRKKFYGSGTVRTGFNKIAYPQSPDIRALWYHKTNREKCLKTRFDSYLIAKNENAIKHVKQKSNYLLLPEKLRFNTAKTTARYSDLKIIGSVYFSFDMSDTTKKFENIDIKKLCKGYCLWLNSSYGVLSFLNIRSSKLTYSDFSINHLESLPLPHPKYCDRLSNFFDLYSSLELKSFPQIQEDSVRQEIDRVCEEIVPNLPSSEDLRRWISEESTVHNK